MIKEIANFREGNTISIRIAHRSIKQFEEKWMLQL